MLELVAEGRTAVVGSAGCFRAEGFVGEEGIVTEGWMTFVGEVRVSVGPRSSSCEGEEERAGGEREEEEEGREVVSSSSLVVPSSPFVFLSRSACCRSLVS